MTEEQLMNAFCKGVQWGEYWSIDAKKNADEVFRNVCMRFCGTD